MRRAGRLWILGLLVLLLALCLVAAGVAQIRNPLLRAAGWALVAGDAPGHADAIVISSDSGAAGALEAAKLFHAGLAPRVAMFPLAPSTAQNELRRRGIAFYAPSALLLQLLHELGIGAVEELPEADVGTNDEGTLLRQWCTAKGYHSILFVSTKDHSRRTRRVLHRALAGSGTQVEVIYARYSDFEPNTWWYSRGGQRTEITEAEKLLLDYLAHPFSG